MKNSQIKVRQSKVKEIHSYNTFLIIWSSVVSAVCVLYGLEHMTPWTQIVFAIVIFNYGGARFISWIAHTREQNESLKRRNQPERRGTIG